MGSTEPLTDEVNVIRGGLMAIVTLRNSIETCKARHGFYGLSFFGDNDLSVEETAKLAGDRLPHDDIRVSILYQLRNLGHEPVRYGEYPHLSLRFPLMPTDAELEELASVFGGPVPNPAKHE